MSELLRDLVAATTGSEWGFSWAAWTGVTVLAMAAGLVLATVGQRMLEPVAVVVALRPARVVRWAGIVAVVSPLAFALLVFSWVGIPLAVLGFFAAFLAAGLGYLAIAAVTGDRLARLAGYPATPWAGIVLGVVVLRVVRLIPLHVGAVVNAGLLWAAYAATCAVTWDLALSWHRRRMPDHEQFAGEQLIEWHPPDAGR